MKIPVIRKVLKDDLARAGGEIPAWLDGFLYTLNQFIETVGSALQGRLTFADNVASKAVTLTFTHGVSQDVAVDQSQKVTGVLPVLVTQSTDTATATANIISGIRVTLKGNGVISIMVNFAGGAGVKASVSLLILYG